MSPVTSSLRDGWKSSAKACSRVLTMTLSEAALPAVELLPPLPLCSRRDEPFCTDASIASAVVYQSSSSSSGSGASGSLPAALLSARSFRSRPAVGMTFSGFAFLGFFRLARISVCAANAGSMPKSAGGRSSQTCGRVEQKGRARHPNDNNNNNCQAQSSPDSGEPIGALLARGLSLAREAGLTMAPKNKAQPKGKAQPTASTAPLRACSAFGR